MAKSRGTMGMRKHRTSGGSQISPSVRHGMKRDAERKSRKRRKSNCVYNSVQEALKNG